jgi:anti-sigma factor RsiW
MMRQMLDEYLDGVLDQPQRSEVEARLAGDSAAAALLARLKSERALRRAAINSFEPRAEEARTIAARALEAFDHAPPAGYVGKWVKRGAAIAAALALAAGSFAIGRGTAPARSGGIAPVAAKAEPQVIYRVMYYADNGDVQVREFASVDDANDFMNKPDTRRGGEPQVAAVDLTRPGSF